MVVVPADHRIASRPKWWPELLLVAGGYGLYHLAQIHAPHVAALRHGWQVFGFERTVRVDFALSMNRYVATREWLALPGDFYYAILHFAVTIGVLVWLWYRRPDHYRQARRVIVAGTLIALAVFWVFPAAPPRLLPGSGFIDTNVAYHTIFNVEQGGASKGADLYATMPSLHFGWALWCAWALSGQLAKRLARVGVYAYPVVTALVVMGTGNHFFVDLIGGAAVMLLGGLVARRLPRLWAEVREAWRPSLPGVWTRALAAIGGPLFLVVVGLSLHSTASTGLRLAGHADSLWLLAVVAEAVSFASFAGLHRRALRIAGFDVGRSTVAAVTLASNAISSSIPLVGSMGGTVNTWRQYRRRGASGSAVTWALGASGVISSVAFTLIVAVGALASGNRAVMDAGAATTVAMLVVASGGFAATRLPALRARVEQAAASVIRRSHWRRSGALTVDPVVAASRFLDHLRSYRPGVADVSVAVSAGVLNWTADAVALALAIRSVGGRVSVTEVVVLWAVAATATSLAFTPSGIGVVEPVLVAGLVLAGVPRASAVAATLLYRFVSVLLPVTVGWIVQLWLTRAARRSALAGPSLPQVMAVANQSPENRGITFGYRPPRRSSASEVEARLPRRPCRSRRRAMRRRRPPPLPATDLTSWHRANSTSVVTVTLEQ